MKPTAEVEAAWTACEEAWGEPKRHDAFFALAAQHDCFAFAAGKYKARAGDATADAQLERIRKAAVAKMMVTGSARDAQQGRPYRATVALIVLMLVAALGGLAYVASLRHGGRPPPPPPPTPTSR